MMKVFKVLFVTVVAIVFANCAGGGGGRRGNPPPVTTIFSMPHAMYGHQATLLHNEDDVLLTGGFNIAGEPSTRALIYDSFARRFLSLSPLNSMHERRAGHQATYLNLGGTQAPLGSVLITGGENLSFVQADTESYDPILDDFLTQGLMINDRRNHTATELDCAGCSVDGYVLVAGGRDNFGILDTAELFNPRTGQFIALGDRLNIGRENHTATVLPDGRVLLAGGNTPLDVINSAETFDPLTLRFTPTLNSMGEPRQHHRALLVGSRTLTSSDDAVLVVGGADDFDFVLNEADLFSPVFDEFEKNVDVMLRARHRHTVTTLPDSFLSDSVVLGGFTTYDSFNLLDSDATAAAEYFRYDGLGSRPDGFFMTTTGMYLTRAMHTATLVDGGRGPIVVTGGVSLIGEPRTSGETF
ncbi:MAG: hypothetical protein HYW47_03720 [Deltaproteobacteria bacterium]|nr:hypothetical protein [Deltaproteobacteria bacterium]